jgi:carbamoyl-phosphate synthase large subunit
MKNILICSAGRRVSLVNYFKKEGKNLISEDIKIYTTDLDIFSSPAAILCDEAISVGKFDSLNYISDLISVCVEKNIGMVIPTIDTELILLAKNKLLFEEYNINLVLSDLTFVEICRNKNSTNDFFNKCGINVPKQYDKSQLKYPLFIKPIDGSNSKNLHVINSENELPPSLLEKDNYMFMEYISPNEYTEYTLDCYYDQQSKLKCVVPRIRIQVRGGEVSKSLTHKNQLIIKKIISSLSIIEGARGCITIQIFIHKENGSILGIEINPRFGGGFPLSFLAGANYPKWLIQEYMLGMEIEEFYDWEDHLLLTRYDAELVVHDYKF